MSLSFPAFVGNTHPFLEGVNCAEGMVGNCYVLLPGAVTGISQSGIGISEKVWMTYDKRELLPGSYNGLADVFVLRDILQNSKNR